MTAGVAQLRKVTARDVVRLLYETSAHLGVADIALRLGTDRRNIYNVLPHALELGVQKHQHGRSTVYSLHSTVPLRPRTPSLEAYYRTDEWRHMRALALQHYGETCILCAAKEKLQVHHRTYERLGRERLNDLIVLCDNCHARYHGKTA